MKIFAIRIKNLASLDGITEIDFTREPLRSAGIFAITGPTGAGKSTILDALCLALYAKTPRYRLAETGIEIKDVQGSTIHQGDVRGILRDGTAEGFAKVDFEGVDGQHYSAAWNVRRAYNRIDGSLQAFSITLSNVSTHTEIPGKKTELLEEIERLVGLNFEQFTRSVLLAQGDFTAFLKAGRDEKSSLLEKLTGTHIYSEISKRIFENHREQLQQLRELNLQRQGIVTLTAEETDAFLEEKAALEAAIRSNEQQAAILRKDLFWHERWSQLQEQVAVAVAQRETANVHKTAALPHQKQLQQIVSVQTIRPVVNRLKDVQEQLAVKTNQAEELNNRLSDLQQQQEIIDEAIEKAAETLDLKTKEEEQAKPLLNSAKALDVQLSEKAEQVKAAEAEAAAIRNKQQQQTAQFEQTREAAALVEQEIARLQQWMAANESRRPIAEQESFILSRLEDAAGILEQLHYYTSRISDAEQKTAAHQQQKQSRESGHASIRDSLEQQQKEYNALQTALAGVDIPRIETGKSAADAQVEELLSATAHWGLLYNTIKEREAQQQLLEQSKKELEQQTEKLVPAEKQLEQKRAEKDAALKIVEKARLVAAESVERLRSQLEPGAPCPVCGSTEHPYTLHNPVLDQVLTELEKSYEQSEVAYASDLALYSSLTAASDQLGKTIATQETGISRQTASIQELEKEWAAYTVYAGSKSIPVSEIQNWLQQQLKEQKEQQKRLQEKLLNYTRQKQELENLGTGLTLLDKRLMANENEIKDIERALVSLEEQQKTDSGEYRKAIGSLDKVKQSLAVYFTSEQWLENWQKDPVAFTKRIRKFALEWKTNTEALEEKDRQQNILVATLKEMREQASGIKEDLARKEESVAQLQALRTEISEARSAIFNGAPVQEVETALSDAVAAARLVAAQKNKEAESLKSSLTRNLAQLEQLEKDKAALREQEAALRKQQDEWLHNYNHQKDTTLTEAGLLSLLAFTQDWIEAERERLRAIDDAAMQAELILDERTKALKEHNGQRSSEKTVEELMIQQKEVELLVKQNNNSVSEIDFRIKEDADNRNRIGLLLQDIEKQAQVVEDWAKLNEMIGAADGKKFRQIAQEYTLDVLLSYANVHLELLSKRYLMQRIPGSLGLQVVDQDMGNEVRTVYSLSGGESFLVSLALALGLASLSSNRMKVESLFIDEGFGSLDPATLNIAMDALERLHNQGRKVGVISHVQEMTERIPVQIRVSKRPSGKSKVEVTGI
ncbi:MAG TPA: SbcC/MukB-like Walker B domain-containing protein [Niabella sp.]